MHILEESSVSLKPLITCNDNFFKILSYLTVNNYGRLMFWDAVEEHGNLPIFPALESLPVFLGVGTLFCLSTGSFQYGCTQVGEF